jgi:predicted amidophosphoribosyltransferase
MSIRNCPECGRIFEFVFKNLCPECIQKEDNESGAVVDYLQNNPGVGIPEISEATGINADKIIKMLKSGRLIIVCEKNGINLLTCERCGKPIANGNFCPQCRDSMTKVLIQGAKESSKPPGVRQDAGSNTGKETGKTNLFTSHFKK